MKVVVTINLISEMMKCHLVTTILVVWARISFRDLWETLLNFSSFFASKL